MPVPASELDFDHTVEVVDPILPFMNWVNVEANGPDDLPFRCQIHFRTPDCCVGEVGASWSRVILIGQKIRFLLKP